jgi:hypothetical protein
MELEPWSRAARGLREHVRQVADALGCTGEAYWVRTEDPVSVYLPLDEHFFGFPGREAALLWDAEHGWSAVIDDPEPLVVAYLGALLPDPAVLAGFVADLVAGRPTGSLSPPSFLIPPDALLAALERLAPLADFVG